MKRIITFALIAAAMAAAVSCRNSNKKEQATEQPEEQIMTFDITKLPEEPVFDIETNLGTITVKLYSDTPKHRDNFAKLASEGFYNGILFHRIIKGFMIQAGDPLSKDPANRARFGTGGPGYEIPAEIVPGHTHKKGALAAARKGDTANPMRNSSGSQFYIVENPEACMHLDGQYTIFGETVKGMEVIDKIAAVQTDARDCPLQEVKIISVKPVLPQTEAPADTTAAE